MLSKEDLERSIATDLGRGWELKIGKLVKLFQFSSFTHAVDFVNEIAKIAEKLDHHLLSYQFRDISHIPSKIDHCHFFLPRFTTRHR